VDPKAILDNLLDTSQTATRKGLEIAEDKMGVPESGPERLPSPMAIWTLKNKN